MSPQRQRGLPEPLNSLLTNRTIYDIITALKRVRR
jgi:hypothetical protein